MPVSRKVLIILAALAAGLIVFFVFFKKKAQASSVGVASGPPTPQAAVTSLLATPPAQIAAAAINSGVQAATAHYLPTIGAGVSTSKADTFNPSDPGGCSVMWAKDPGYSGPGPLDPKIWCSPKTNSAVGWIAGLVS